MILDAIWIHQYKRKTSNFNVLLTEAEHSLHFIESANSSVSAVGEDHFSLIFSPNSFSYLGLSFQWSYQIEEAQSYWTSNDYEIAASLIEKEKPSAAEF